MASLNSTLLANAHRPESPPGIRWTPRKIAQHVNKLGKWFHNMELGGVRTAPEHALGDYPSVKWKRFAHAIPSDLTGKSVLDIGCNAGFYSLEMKRRGAARVLGIDSSEEYLAQARFASEVSGAEIEFRKLSVYQLGELNEKFDIVLFLGVLYHLRHPLLALDLIREFVAKDIVIVQSMLRGTPRVAALKPDYPFKKRDVFQRVGYPELYFIENNYAGDPTNWWVPNNACLEAMIRSAGFQILDHPEREVYVCRCVQKMRNAFVELPEAFQLRTRTNGSRNT